MPLRKMDFISSVLALAEPVPFTVAILMVKSLIRFVTAIIRRSWACGLPASAPHPRRGASGRVTSAYPMRLSGNAPRRGRSARTGPRPSPSPAPSAAVRPTRRAAGQVARGDLQPPAQLRLRAIGRDGEAVHGTDIEAGIALDAELRGEDGLHVA